MGRPNQAHLASLQHLNLGFSDFSEVGARRAFLTTFLRETPALCVRTSEFRLNDHADDRRVLVHGHTLMSNHVHLVVTGQEEGGVSRLMQHVTVQYAQYLHGRLNRRGRLWQSRFYSCVLDAHHFLTALAYVDLNAVRAGMVKRAADYAWSSAAAHCGVGKSWPPRASPTYL